ncbi:MAG: hypothetical protein LAN62_00635 [Acidobacteriia bacterium]|nr:hypothetical protein [Terriglobia bacterium]
MVLLIISAGRLLAQGSDAGLRTEFRVKYVAAGAVYLDHGNNAGLEVGRSSATGDARSSLNQMYGVTMGRIWKTGIRGDVKYSEFSSSFGRGNYSVLSLSRSFRETLQCEFLMGKQNLVSPLTRNSSYRSLGGNVNWFPRMPMYFDGGFTRQHGTIQNYNQWYIGLGYRFDSFRQRGRASEAK